MNDSIETAYRKERHRLVGWMERRIGKDEAEDALHDVIVRTLVNLDTLEGVRDLTAWLWRCAARAVIDVWRKRRRRRIADGGPGAGTDELDRIIDEKILSAESTAEREELLEALTRAIGNLPAEQREVIVAQSLNGESFKSIAERTGVPAETLAGRKRYALAKLRESLTLTGGLP
jgi:RNA polymerase sigma factor (sigma-70 family)